MSMLVIWSADFGVMIFGVWMLEPIATPARTSDIATAKIATVTGRVRRSNTKPLI